MSIFIIALGLALFIFFIVTDSDKSVEKCNYCNHAITNDADYVVDKADIAWHAECYIRHLKEVNDE